MKERIRPHSCKAPTFSTMKCISLGNIFYHHNYYNRIFVGRIAITGSIANTPDLCPVFNLIILITFFTFIGNNLSAQVFPIQVNTQLVPPYTPYLSDYTAPGAQKLMVQIRVNDPTLSNYTCKLRITIDGVGITIRTKHSFIPQPIELEGGGIPQMLYGEDLLEYFNPNNLDFSGMSRTEFAKTSKLPQGVYRFSVEVLDYNRNTLVSNKATTMAWIILNDPPILNIPRKDTKVTIFDPTNIVFNWTPRHTSSPNAAFSTQYIFRMVEVWPETRNPYDAFLSQKILYEVMTDNTQLLYGPSEPALIPGRKYAWQVQAKDADGRDLFKNEGRSEVFVFQFGDALGAPENLYLQNANTSTLTVRWDQSQAGTEAVNYRVRYRPSRNSGPWYESQTTDQWKAIAMLQPDTEYEVQVRTEQKPLVSPYSVSGFFKTLLQKQDEFVCKPDVTPPPIPASTLPVFPLGINDTIHAGGYEVLVREVTGANGVYSGRGVAIVPYFNSAKVQVTFENISVNNQFWLTSGVIKSVWNAESKFLKSIEKPTAPGTTLEGNGAIDITVIATDSLVSIEGAAIVSVTRNSEGDIVVETSDGGSQTLKKGTSYSVVDEVGNGYVTDKEGNIAKTTASEAMAANQRGKRNYNITLQFENAGVFGVDKKKYEVLSQYYQVLEDGTPISWKALSTTKPDFVSARLQATDIDATKLKFEVNSTPTNATTTDNKTFTLNLQGKSSGMQEELIATYTASENGESQVLGKLNLSSYDEVINNLVIVPVNEVTLPTGVSITNIANKLSAIYGQAVADWRVSLTTKISVDLADKFNDGETGLLTNYTDDMKKVINAFGGKLQDKTYYLFLVSKPLSGQTLGYMPRSKQAGFIFVDMHGGDTEKFYKTIAHELGHGAFNLKHTFSEYPALAQSSTDNLMDYSTGTALYKHQWDHVHEPQRVIGLFEGDEDGALKKLTGTYTVYVGDSVMKDKKIFADLIKTEKLYAKYEPTQNDTTTSIHTKVIYRPEWSKKDIIAPADSWKKISVNTKTQLPLDSLPEGKYLVLFKDRQNKIDTVTFYLRAKKYDFACKVCGRDLKVTLDKLTTMSLRKSIEMTEQHAKLLNDLLKQAGFNSCKSHAHFFSQSCHETSGFSKFVESTNFSINGFYSGATFVKNCNTKILYNQSFWDNKTYKEYFAVGPLYETSTSTTASQKFLPKTDSFKKYKWNSAASTKSDFASCANVIVAASDTIKYPTLFETASTIPPNTTFYTKYTLTNEEKEACGKKLYSLLYATFLGNGDAASEEGYNYRGRGFVHLTGKNNYGNVSEKCNSFFSTDFDFKKDYEKVTTDMTYVIYSAVAFYLNKNAVADLHKKNCLQVTKIVNGSTNGYDDEEHSKYQRLMLFRKYKTDIFYGCNINEDK